MSGRGIAGAGGVTVTRRGLLTGAAAAWALTLVGCAPGNAGPFALACGEPGGAYLQFGELLRNALRERSRVELTLKATHGSAENLELLASGSVDLALSLADTANEGAAQHGFVAIGRVYQNYLQCLVLDDSDISSLADLAGRRVSVGAPGSGSSHTTRRLLTALASHGGQASAGQAAPIVAELELAPALQALTTGSIDALFWSGGIPTPEITDFSATTPLRLVDLADGVTPLETAHPREYLDTRIPAGVYGSAQTITTIGISNLLMARAELDAIAARALVDVLVVDAARLIPSGSVGLQYLTLATLIDTGSVPLHPAARERYRELYR